ncbi:MoaD family protein [Geoglobus ahangari]|uniref:MoaD family protein n=1 Tax=Geoglobus ahangari TaxID=113653 RepID=A0A0F7IDJ2_9EURY|nr:MoaD family protein [Geoglobus ahangari]AKG91508.1 MoaD family protein [Geoglobus ahangari]
MVVIELFATLRERYGKRAEVDARTLEEAVRKACEVFGEEFYREVYEEDGTLRDDRIILINGRNVKDMEKIPELREGDRIAIFPPIAGG